MEFECVGRYFCKDAVKKGCEQQWFKGELKLISNIDKTFIEIVPVVVTDDVYDDDEEEKSKPQSIRIKLSDYKASEIRLPQKDDKDAVYPIELIPKLFKNRKRLFLGFLKKELAIQWQNHLTIVLSHKSKPNKSDNSLSISEEQFVDNDMYGDSGEGSFIVSVVDTEKSRVLGLTGTFHLQITDVGLEISKTIDDLPTFECDIKHIRRYGKRDKLFVIEFGNSTKGGPGNLTLQTDDNVKLFNAVHTLKTYRKQQEQETDELKSCNFRKGSIDASSRRHTVMHTNQTAESPTETTLRSKNSSPLSSSSELNSVEKMDFASKKQLIENKYFKSSNGSFDRKSYTVPIMNNQSYNISCDANYDNKTMPNQTLDDNCDLFPKHPPPPTIIKPKPKLRKQLDLSVPKISPPPIPMEEYDDPK